MTKNSNIQLLSNVYPVKANGERIDFTENRNFVARVWDRGALIKFFKFVHHTLPDARILERYTNGIHGLSKWQIRRIMNPDDCSLCPGEKPWGIVIRGENFDEVCKCDRRDCNEFSKCRPDMETKDGIKK